MSTDVSERPRRTPADEEIPALLEALAASGASVAAFAREHGLAAWKLYKAQRRARGKARRRRGQRRRPSDPEFVRVEIVEEGCAGSAPLELVLCSGDRIVIPSGFDEATLRRVMGVLRSC